MRSKLTAMGVVDEEDVRLCRELFRAKDANHDGALSDEEAEAARRLDAEIWTRTERPERFSAELTHIERRDWFTKQVLLPLFSHTGSFTLAVREPRWLLMYVSWSRIMKTSSANCL